MTMTHVKMKLYRLFIFIKNLLYDVGAIQPAKINAKIISVGNVLLGGTGKTPTTIAIANFLQKKGTWIFEFQNHKFYLLILTCRFFLFRDLLTQYLSIYC